MGWIAGFFIYAVAVAAFDRTAHRMVYPLVGWGYPLTGWRRWLLRIFSPFVAIGLWFVMAPIFILVVVAMTRTRK